MFLESLLAADGTFCATKQGCRWILMSASVCTFDAGLPLLFVQVLRLPVLQPSPSPGLQVSIQ